METVHTAPIIRYISKRLPEKKEKIRVLIMQIPF